MTPQELKIRRDRLGLTQEELAEKLGVTGTTVYRWESGQRAITPILRWALQAIEDELANLSHEEQHRRNLATLERHDREAQERWAQMTPEERAAVERWFGQH